MRLVPMSLLTLAVALNAQGQIPTLQMRQYRSEKPSVAPLSSRPSASPSPSRTRSSIASLDSFFTRIMPAYGIPGIAACMIKNKKVVWEGYYGLADVARNIPVSDSTIFYLGSIAKTITATALMQLYEAGRFRLDDSVNGYLPFAVRNPNFPNVPISFRMILTHTSSIRDNWNLIPMVAGDSTTPLGTYLQKYLSPEGELYDATLNYHPITPGRAWNYSNIGTSLSAYLVERLSGIPFDRYCRDSIFSPLRMSHTAWFLKDLDTTLIARPYSFPSGSPVDNGLYGSPAYPAGQLKATVPALARFLLANMNRGELDGSRILDSGTVRLMQTRWFTGNPWEPYTGQGLEWWNEVLLGRQCWDRKGSLPGARTAMYSSEENGTGAIWFTNCDPDSFSYDLITERLMATADTLGGSTERPKFNKGILLVNGVDFSTYGTEIRSAYQDKVFSGDFPVSFWDCFPSEPSGGYPSTLPAPVGRGPVSLKTLGDYSTVVWIGNNYSGDWYSWVASPVLSYLFLGGNVILLTKNGQTFFNSVMNDYLGITWAEKGQTLSGTAATYAGLTALRPLGTQSLNDVFSTSLAGSESSLLFSGTGPFSGERGVGVWRKPSSGGQARSSGGNFVYIAGRPYRWNHADLKASMVSIVKNMAGEVLSAPKEFDASTPARYSLEQNYPNPFNPTTVISFQLPAVSQVQLAVYDILGQEVAVMVDERQGPGRYEVTWDASAFSSGIYVYRLTAGSFVQTRKMLVVK